MEGFYYICGLNRVSVFNQSAIKCIEGISLVSLTDCKNLHPISKYRKAAIWYNYCGIQVYMTYVAVYR